MSRFDWRRPSLLGAGIGVVAGLLLYLLLGGRFGTGSTPTSPAPTSIQRPAEGAAPTLVSRTPEEPETALANSSWLHLRVRSARGGALAGATAYFVSRSAIGADRTTTRPFVSDERGLILIPSSAVPPRESELRTSHVLLVTARDHLASSLAPAAFDPLLGQPETKELTLTLQRGAGIAGSVRSVQGEPVAGARIEVLGVHGRALRIRPTQRPGPRAAQDLLVATTDEAGRFEVHGIPGFPVEVRVRHRGYVHPRPARLVEDDSQDIEFVLHPYLTLGVIAQDASTGRVIPSTAVSLAIPVPGIQRWAYGMGSRPVHAPPEGRDARTGAYWMTFIATPALTRAPPHPCEVLVDAPGFATARVGGKIRFATASKHQALVVPMRRLRPHLDRGTLELRVTTASPQVSPHSIGLRLRSLDAKHEKDAGSRFYELPLEKGRGRLDLPVGQYEIEIGGTTSLLWWLAMDPALVVSIRKEAPTIVSRRLPGGFVTLRAEEPDGTPLDVFRTNIMVGRHLTLTGSADVEQLMEDGSMRGYRALFGARPGRIAAYLAPGKYAFFVHAPGFEGALHRFTIVDGEDLEIRQVLQPGR